MADERIGLKHPERERLLAEYRGEPERKHKYNAKSMKIDGHVFPSRREAQHYRELKLMERAGKIKDLQIQVPYNIEVNGIHITVYVADFVFYNVETKRQIVADVKGFVTDVFRLKKKLMRAVYGIEITEVR